MRSIARITVEVDPAVPYSLLAFYLNFYLSDLPLTSRPSLNDARSLPEKRGVRNVRIGNAHLLQEAD